MFSGSISSTRSKIEIALLVVAQRSRISAPSSIARRHALRRIFGEEQLALRHLDDARPVLVVLVVVAQAVVGDDAARVDLGDQAAPAPARRSRCRAASRRRSAARSRPSSTARPGSSASGIWRSRIAHQRVPVVFGRADARQRLQRLGVGRAAARAAAPTTCARAAGRAAGPRPAAPAGAGTPPAARGVGDDALDLHVQDAGEVLVLAQPRVDLDQRVQRLAVVRDPGARPLPGAAPRPPDPAAGRAGCRRCGCRISSFSSGLAACLVCWSSTRTSSAGWFGALEDAFQARQRVAIAGHRLSGSRSAAHCP